MLGFNDYERNCSLDQTPAESRKFRKKRLSKLLHETFDVICITRPKSDQHQVSPCYINALQNIAVMRITDMITKDEFG